MAALPRTWPRAAASALLAAAGLLAAAAPASAGESRRLPGAGHELGVPADGNDRIRLDDGRVMSCKVEEAKDGYVLKFASFTTPKIPKSRVIEWRKWADYDSTPRTEEEKGYAAKGQVRFNGRWMPQEAAAKLVKAEQDAARKVREEDDSRSEWKNRWQVETAHFKIEANITRDALDYYMDFIETFYDHFAKAFGVQLTQRGKSQKLQVYLFGKRDQFVKYAEADMPGRGDKVAGYFMNTIGKEKLVFYDAPGARDYTTEVMYHELTHFVIHLAEPQVMVPRWLNEGLADYFEGSEYDGKKFLTGGVNDEDLLHFQEMMRTEQTIPFEKLLKSGNPFAEGKEEKPIEFESECYAESWAIVHYLMEGKKQKYRLGFISFLNKFLEAKGKFTAISGSEMKHMDYDEVRMQLGRCLGVKDVDSIFTEVREYAKTLPLVSAMAYADRGEISWFLRKDQAAALKDFEEAVTRGKDDPKVLARLGIIYRNIPEKVAEAVPLLRRSLELNPLNPRPRFFLALMLPPDEQAKELETCIQVDPDYAPALSEYALMTYSTRLRDRDKADRDEVEMVRQAIAMVERAILLDPSERAYFTLSSLCMSIGEFEKARDAQRIAVELSPDDMNYLWRLAECHALLGQSEEFAKLLRRIELLYRRAGRATGGATAREGSTHSREEIDDQMAILVRRMAEKCMFWQKYKEAAIALKSWYEKRAPKSEDDWVFYASVLSMGGDRAGASEVANRGLGTFPDSDMLKQYAKETGAAGTEGAPAEGGK